jgi:hypothetical protein
MEKLERLYGYDHSLGLIYETLARPHQAPGYADSLGHYSLTESNCRRSIKYRFGREAAKRAVFGVELECLYDVRDGGPVPQGHEGFRLIGEKKTVVLKINEGRPA